MYFIQVGLKSIIANPDHHSHLEVQKLMNLLHTFINLFRIWASL